MVEFDTIEAEEIKFGRNNFIEVSRKKALTDNGDVEFISIARGFYLPDGQKGFKTSITLPSEKEKRKQIAELIKKY
jgi:Mor family transcriptional regulator